MKLRAALRTLTLTLALPVTSTAEKPEETVTRNSEAVVYLEVTDASGGVVDRGTGFIVSHDGHVVTAAHIMPADGQTMWAVIGQREGTRYKIVLRDVDAVADTAVWQLPASSVCRPAVTLSTKGVNILDRVMVLGFPGSQGLSPARVGITNLASDVGFYKADGMLQPGNSGGPVFDETGHVIGLVQGGTMPGTDNNDIVPVSTAIALLRKRGVAAGFDTPPPYKQSCYATCRLPVNGVERYNISRPWGPVDSGWVGGGHSNDRECAKIIAGALAGNPTARIVLAPGKAGMWEDSKKDWLGKLEYKYHCRGTYEADPVYYDARSPECGLRK